MSWEIKIDWDTCPYLKDYDGKLHCNNSENKTFQCKKENCKNCKVRIYQDGEKIINLIAENKKKIKKLEKKLEKLVQIVLDQNTYISSNTKEQFSKGALETIRRRINILKEE